jgi:D-alanyl-D-alanine carboxypeptidase (penicillin-binding protein 5/6)
MKAAENPDLAGLIARLEKRAKRKEMATNIMAAVGLVGFGIMLVPVLTAGRTHLSLALPSLATSTAPGPDTYAGIQLAGRAAIVYDLVTGETLYEKEGERQLPLASLTKLLTTYAAATTLDMNAPVTISEAALAADGDSGLSAGETFAFKDIARYALVASSNDAAAAIAETAAGKRALSDRSLLASAAEAVGLTHTYALNGTGLDETTNVSGGYGTAHDVALLAGALLKASPAIARATIESSVSVSDYQGVRHSLPNTNQDIVRLPNPLLSKTGFTDLAGGNLVVVFDAGIGHPIAVVVLGSTREGRFSDVDTLVSRTLSHFAGIAP